MTTSSLISVQIKAELIETLPHYQEQDKAFDKFTMDGFAGSLMASNKKRERIEKEQELKNQDCQIESNHVYVAQSGKPLARIDSDCGRQLHAERTGIHGQAEKLAQDPAKQAPRQPLGHSRQRREASPRIWAPTRSAPLCSRGQCCSRWF